MKEVINCNHSSNKREILYWIHFALFTISNLNFSFVSYVRATILVMYLFVFVYMKVKRTEFELPSKYILILFGVYILLNTLFVKTISVHIIYLAVTFMIIKEFRFSKSELLALINKTAIVYFVLSVILGYTSLNALSVFGPRQIENKFFPHLLFRFIGIEGTPAGADIFFLVVLLSNIFLNKAKNKYIFITLSIIVLLWTSSLAPVVSIIGALLILPFTKNKVAKITYSGMLWLYQFIVIIMYGFGSLQLQNVLNVCSTWRARIWFNMYWGLIEHNTTALWVLGRKDLVEFSHRTDTIINNPHNFSLFLLQFGGIIAYIIIIVVATMYFKDMNDKYMIYVVSALLIYASTNTFIFTIRGNPIFVYILVLYLSSGKEPKLE
ncbi:hypothetical protein LGK95_10665 [Clostridium algoriphilum]|uniref:hypothetical protein n=1 Tax=Clostridium algoriphilum TaxID=198347 RepID=UPI001CF21FFD|nr:hypothetical protein [Clostridium algoriphilum]MCB2293980.1 hypothetical protein [Clostridium algoriphilum]